MLINAETDATRPVFKCRMYILPVYRSELFHDHINAVIKSNRANFETRAPLLRVLGSRRVFALMLYNCLVLGRLSDKALINQKLGYHVEFF